MKDDSATDLTIMGIGSSAGGLEAIRELVGTLPVDAAVSYVIVQHMSPHHKSLMTLLVSRESKLKVMDVTDGVVPQANVVYVTPPKTDVIIKDGKLRLQQPSAEAAAPKPSVDRFLVSLAKDRGEKSMAIILSGTGSDGAYGVQAIREAGGITIAQDDASAKYDGMPMSAIETGCVDLILRPNAIGTQLEKILKSPRDFGDFRRDDVAQTPTSDLLQILLARTRVDFRDYKQSTIQRRIERQMVFLNIKTQEEYTAHCRSNPQAVDALFKDLLISVTRFFRDKAEFEALDTHLGEMVESAKNGVLRIWIAGCATGEEAYSIAILLAEHLGGPEVSLKNHVQIFATDIDSSALQVARNGTYNVAGLDDVPKHLAKKYFVRHGDTVRVIDNLRSAILFSNHNLCQDPPFQNVDLVCCRNLLIYFGNSLQKKVMSRFHYSLKQQGMLFLGTAESVAGTDGLFMAVSGNNHIFRKRSLKQAEAAGMRTRANLYSGQPRQIEAKLPESQESSDRLLFDALVSSLGENSMLVTDEYAIVRVYGDVSRYVQFNESSNLKLQISLLRSPLREEARSLVTLALKNNQKRVGVKHLLAEDDKEAVRLEVFPIHAKTISERAALIVFVPVEANSRPSSRSGTGRLADSDTDDRILSLEAEVATTREALQQTVEELETSNEELQSLNEELQSTNEELQATNEELETSNEELQSTNEELITVNEELQISATELGGRTSELSSVLESAPAAILVVDSALQIVQATHAAVEMFDLPQPLSGPHISQTKLPDNFPALAPICSEALQIGLVVTKEIHSGHSVFRLTCSPFFDERGRLLGVTVVVVDFPRLAQDMEMMLEQSDFLIMNRGNDGTILSISKASAASIGLSREDAVGKNIYQFVDDTSADRIREMDQKLLAHPDNKIVDTFRVQTRDSDQVTWMTTQRFAYENEALNDTSVLALGTDVTDVVLARQEAEARIKQLELLQDVAKVGFWEVDLVKQTVIWSEEVFRLHGETPETYAPELETAMRYYHPEDFPKVEQEFTRVAEKGGQFDFKLRLQRKDKSIVTVHSIGMSIEDLSGKTVGVIGVFREVVN